MYRIDKSTNDITQLQKRRFSELGFKERENLHEWIAKNPEVLRQTQPVPSGTYGFRTILLREFHSP